ncbi:MAG TPA: type II secretion system secretin GspD, partial [Acetobacteraceae bacterium]|nr:type II secretion system secretin GspD [Acetobacteraceae bacterium]
MRFARAQCDAEGRARRRRRRSSIGSENRTVPDRAPGTTTMINRLSAPGMLLAAIVLLTGCATTYRPDRGMESLPSAPLKSAASVGDATTPPRGPLPEGTETTKVFRGTGVLVKGQQSGGALPPAPPGAVSSGPAVTLNFEGAELREVIRNILTDILGESYTIDPAVGGTVTIRTTSGIPREALPATLEMILRSNGATMIKEGTIWKVVPAATAVRGNITPQLGNSSRAIPPGFGVQIVPLKYVGVRQMMAILEPFQKDATTIRADDLRNLLIISGTELELRHMLETIDMFDVNWLAGMSFGLFTLQSAEVKTVVAELDKAMGPADKSPLGGILRIIPIERMNALLVVTPQPAYLEEAKRWIERLDKGDAGGGVRFYVYQVQNSRAERIGPLLQQAFTGRAPQQASSGPPTLAPGTPAGTIVSPPSFQAQPSSAVPVPAQPQTTIVQQQGTQPPAGGPVAQAVARALANTPVAADGSVGVVRNVQVVADKDNNTILIVATPAEYAVIEAALKKLDVPQRQVLIQLTIAEVALTDDLSFGVDWLFRGGAPSGRGSGGNFNSTKTPFNPQPTGTSTTTSAVGLALQTGFNYILNSASFPGGIQAALHLLDSYGSTRVISNPHLSALDNQKATIKVGDRIPINQQTFVGGATTGTVTNAVTTTSQYIDTGVLVQVTPHINAGGLVTLEVNAEVSNPGNPANPGDAPPISTRSVQTLLAVPSGQTMVMGGLITENKQNTSNGLPLVSRVPVLGGLFGNQDLKNNRTELVLFITPQVLES